MTVTMLVSFAAMFVLLVVAAVCASAETALFSLAFHERIRLRKIAPKAAHAVALLLARPREFLVSILFVNLMASTLYMVLTTIVAMELQSGLAKLLVSAFNLIVHTVLAEVVSKMVAARRRVEFCRFLAPTVLAGFRVLGPLRVVLDRGLVAPLTRLFIAPESAQQAMTESDLSALLSAGTADGAIDHNEQRVLRQVVRLNTLRVRDVMTPRIDVDWLDLTATPDAIRTLARTSGRTRIPVHAAGGESEIAGMLDVKKYLVQAALGKSPPLQDALEPVCFVPERAAVDLLLEDLRRRGAKVAMCVDEHGAIVGVVSIADIVGRLIAESTDDETRTDPADQPQLIGLGTWSVPGRLSAADWAEMFSIPLDRRFSTLSGLIFSQLGRLPRVGDVVHLGNLRLEVESLAGRMADRVRVSLVSDAAKPASSPRPTSVPNRPTAARRTP